MAHALIPQDSGLYEKYGLDDEVIFFRAARRPATLTAE
jgi:hypothetical protein